jgi:hypothetical protein
MREVIELFRLKEGLNRTHKTVNRNISNRINSEQFNNQNIKR